MKWMLDNLVLHVESVTDESVVTAEEFLAALCWYEGKMIA
jgi:hypothetical protein